MENSQNKIENLPSGTLRQKIFHNFRSLYSNEYTFLIFFAILIGVLGGLSNFVFVLTYETIYENVIKPFWSTPYIVFVLLSGAVVLYLLSKIFSSVQLLGYGFPRFLEKINLSRGYISLRSTFGKSLGSCASLGFGGSAGQEGPIAQLGGALGSLVGQIIHLSRSKTRVFIACGIASAIASTFNAPITGVLFAQEIALFRDFKIGSFIPIVISSAVGTVISQSLTGIEPIFSVPPYLFINYYELLFYSLLGLIIGVYSSLFVFVYFKIKDLFESLKYGVLIKLLIGGLCIGVVGIFFPYILGNGYELTERALQDKFTLWILVGLIFLKPLATSITLNSGWPGGIFAPSLFVGAALGNAYGMFVEKFINSPFNLSTSYATVAMGALLAALTQAPLTSIFLIFELTHSYQVVIPIMITSVLSWVVSRIIVGGSIESLELRRLGVNVDESSEELILKKIKVRDIMKKKVETIPENMTLRKLIELIPKSIHTTFPLVDSNGLLSGIISVQDIRELLFEESVKDIVVVKEIATLKVISITPDQSLYNVMNIWGNKPGHILPVVESKNSKKIVGYISKKDFIAAYNKAITEIVD